MAEQITKESMPNLENFELVDKKPEWVVGIDKELNDQRLMRIIRFFVIESPCKDVSTLGKPLSSYGWEDDAIKKNGWLEKRILSIMELNKHTLFCAQRLTEMKDKFMESQMDESFPEKQQANRVVMLLSECIVLSMFRHIRNSFAHLRFAIVGENKDILAFENGIECKDKFKVKARMLIKIDTLIDVIECIEKDRPKMDSEKEIEKKQIEKAILELINTQAIKSLDEIYQKLEIKQCIIRKVIKQLQEEKTIEYSRSLHCWKQIDKEEPAA